jgi:hypothetical protein
MVKPVRSARLKLQDPMARQGSAGLHDAATRPVNHRVSVERRSGPRPPKKDIGSTDGGGFERAVGLRDAAIERTALAFIFALEFECLRGHGLLLS